MRLLVLKILLKIQKYVMSLNIDDTQGLTFKEISSKMSFSNGFFGLLKPICIAGAEVVLIEGVALLGYIGVLTCSTG